MTVGEADSGSGGGCARRNSMYPSFPMVEERCMGNTCRDLNYFADGCATNPGHHNDNGFVVHRAHAYELDGRDFIKPPEPDT